MRQVWTIVITVLQSLRAVSVSGVRLTSPASWRAGSATGKRAFSGNANISVEELWRQFFSDTSQWWDHTTHKVSPKYPDFKHKKTGVALWIDKKSNPSWVKTELLSMPPGSVCRSLHSWNVMISGCVKADPLDALKLYNQMQVEGVEPDAFTFARVINACAKLMALDQGRYVHAQLIKSGCDSDMFVGNTLVHMYAKCGSIEDAQRVFHKMSTRDVVSWNAMLAGYMKCEQAQNALQLFAQMQKDTVKPNPVTFVVVLNACASLTVLEEGRHIHTELIKSGCESDMFVGSALVDMYAKCGSIEDAQVVFHKMPTRDVVSWNAMLVGYVKCDQGQKALELFALMQKGSVNPDSVTFIAVLNACASIMALEVGRRVHAQLIQHGCESDKFVANALVDMYAKCGSIRDGQRVFNKMPAPDVVSWNAMLGGFAMHGQGKEALHLFQKMCQTGVKMDVITFVCLLSACSHGGLVEEGIQFFESMLSVYGIPQTVDHYVCMVDLLGRAGRLDEAENLLRSEPKTCKDSVALIALLGACRNHGEIEMGERIAKQLLELNRDSDVDHVLLSNICAASGLWKSCDRVHELQNERGVNKPPGRTKVDTQVHSFVVDDQVHPHIGEIHAELCR